MRFSLKERPVLSGVVGNAVYALLILGGGVLLAYLKVYYPDWFTIVLWALVGCALMTIPVIAFVLIARLPKRPEEITEQNVEGYIRQWLDAFSIAVKKNDSPEAYFGLVATYNNGLSVNIHRLKNLGRYVLLRSAILIVPEHKEVFDNLPEEEKEVFSVRFNVELSKTAVGGYIMDLKEGRVILERRIPITTELTEGSFMDAIDQLQSAHFHTIATWVLMITDEQKRLKGALSKRRHR